MQGPGEHVQGRAGAEVRVWSNQEQERNSVEGGQEARPPRGAGAQVGSPHARLLPGCWDARGLSVCQRTGQHLSLGQPAAVGGFLAWMGRARLILSQEQQIL